MLVEPSWPVLLVKSLLQPGHSIASGNPCVGLHAGKGGRQNLREQASSAGLSSWQSKQWVPAGVKRWWADPQGS